eukprot:gene3086-3365_t
MDAMRLNGAKQRAMNANSSRIAPMMNEIVLLSRRDALQHSRPQRRLAVQVQSTVQLTVPKTVTAPRQMPAKSIALEPVVQEATISYGKPLRGSPTQLGATYNKEAGAINFALQTAGAKGVKLCLFTEADLANGKATYEITLDPMTNKTGDIWHIALPSCDQNLLYGYRVSGPSQDKDNSPAAAGHKFDDTQVIIDPYAKAILSRRRYGELGPSHLDYEDPEVLGLAETWPQAAAFLPKPQDEEFDWEGDRPLEIPLEDLVIYEMHVRGFTAHPSAGVQAPGTYLGLIEKLDYLKSLGVNAIELLPVFEFNELEYYSPIPGSPTNEFRFNFWGYSTVNFFSPMARYSYAIGSGADGSALQQEFKLLVREAHKRGIEVILDVVFNHTAEGNEKGPTLSFRGLDNRVYYMLAPLGEYYNYSGCGNTLNCNHPTVRKFIVDCLKYWVTEFHVDGFRFDLASIMTRAHSAWHPASPTPTPGAPPAALHSGGGIVDETGIMTDGAGVPTGTPVSDPPLVAAISEDPVLRDVKLIAEAWDCDGLYQVGAFPHYGGRWAEWNGSFRDTVRQFLKGTEGPWAGNFASALCGSPNLYANTHPAETDWWANNAGRRWRGNRSPTASINFVSAHDGFALADLMGDEYGHSKKGNNNTYCHDSDLNWVNWQQATHDEEGFARFVRRLIHFRHMHPELRRTSYVNDNDIQWHGEAAFRPDWTDSSRLVAYTLKKQGPEGGGLYVAFNTGHVPKTVELPNWHGRAWKVVVDTSKLTPFDILIPDEELAPEEAQQAQLMASMWTASGFYSLLPWSCVVLESVPEPEMAALRSRGKGQVATLSAFARAAGPVEPTAEQLQQQRAAKRAAPAESLMEEIRASKTGSQVVPP